VLFRSLSKECGDLGPYSLTEMRQFVDRVTPYFAEVVLRV
jgi:hypothetical protein